MTLYEPEKMADPTDTTIRPSLVVTTYNWKEALALTLASALQQTTLPFEIVVADDGSTDDTRQLIEQYAAEAAIPIRHIWQEDKGFRLAKSRNRAIAAAQGNYIILIDGDIIVENHFIEDHLAAIKKNYFIQGSRVLLKSACSEKLLQSQKLPTCFLSTGVANRKNCIRSPLLSKLFSWNSTSYQTVRTCNFAFWKHDAIAINGFNEDFVGWGREDSEFTARMLHYGIRRKNLHFRATAYHLYHPMHDRKHLPGNDRLLHQTIKNKLTWCERGLHQYLS